MDIFGILTTCRSFVHLFVGVFCFCYCWSFFFPHFSMNQLAKQTICAHAKDMKCETMAHHPLGTNVHRIVVGAAAAVQLIHVSFEQANKTDFLFQNIAIFVSYNLVYNSMFAYHIKLNFQALAISHGTDYAYAPLWINVAMQKCKINKSWCWKLMFKGRCFMLLQLTI